MKRTLVATVVATMIATLGGIPRSAGAVETGRGTGHSLIRALDVRVGDDLRVAVVQSDTTTTLDSDRAGTGQNGVFRDFAAADMTVLGTRHTVPDPTWQVSSTSNTPGAREEDTAALEARVPDGSNPADSAIGELRVATQLPSLGQVGWVTEATLTPSRIDAGFDPVSGGTMNAALNVGSIRVLDGLVGFEQIGPGEIRGATSPDANSTGTRGLEIGNIDLLDVDALSEIAGLDGLAGLAVGPLARLSDKMGLSLSSPGTDLSSYGSWEAAVNAMDSVRADLDSAVLGGLGCLGLSSSLRTRIDAAFQALGRSALDCLSGVLVSTLASDFAGVVAGFAAQMRTGLTSQPLIRLTDVGGNTEAAASVTADGRADLSSTAWARVGSVFVSGQDVGGFATDLALTTLDELEAAIDAKLADTLGVLGAEYSGLVTVDLLPVLTRRLETRDDYATASAAVSLLAVTITPPGTIAHDLATVLGDVAPTAPTSSAAIGDGDTVDLSGAIPTSAVSPAPVVRGQTPGLEPVTMVVGSLTSEAEHTRPGVDLPDSGPLPQSCDRAVCTPAPDSNDSNDSNDSSTGLAAPAPAELPRTGAGHLMALAALGSTALIASARLRRFARRIS